MSRLIASEVRPLARASSHRPMRMRAMIAAEVSKYTSCGSPRPCATLGKSVRNALYRYAVSVPTTTSVFMFVVPCRAAAQAGR